MKITNDGNWSSCRNRVILVGDTMEMEGFTEHELMLIDRFRKQDKDSATIDDLDQKIILVKSDENAEKMRMKGAKIRSIFSCDVASIAIRGAFSASVSFTEGLLLANYQFLKYFKESERQKKQNLLSSIHLSPEVTKEDCQELLHTYEAVSWARTMVNEPVSFLTAEQFAQEMVALSNTTSITSTVLEKTQLESLKMGGILAVNKGSIDPPTMTILEYNPANAKNDKPIVLVGKGVVYDTGGLSLKPTPNSMDAMKSDMGGAACVAGAIYLAAKQELPLHIVALVPATDNRPGLNAYAPGDVIKMYNGLTVEVLNTDAEGRMILADALSYSKKYQPALVVDAATLTGAAFRAVGEHGICMMGNADERYFQQLHDAGETTYERTVRFPFWDEYGDEMKSSIADLKNIGGPTAGMITAGKFLEHFVEAPYIHLDIAGPAWRTSDNGYRTKGGTGAGVRLLYHFLKNMN